MAADDAGAILAQVRRWARAQGGLRAGLVATAMVLVATAAGRLLGVLLPAGVWLAVPAAALAAWAWPLDEKGLLQAGRRLGVGERVAALDVLVQRGARALVGPLLAEIAALRRRMWRLVLGPLEIGAAVVALGLALAVGTVPFPTRSPAAGETPPLGTALTEAPSPAGLLPAEPRPEPSPTVPGYPTPADAPTYSPYADLLAAVLGLEGDLAGGLRGEELTARLAQEEGLLRTLAERLAQVGAGGLSPSERAGLLPLAQEVARADLRERLGQLLNQGDEPAAREARDAVTAVLQALERTGEDAGGGLGSPASGSSAAARHPVLGAEAAHPELNGVNGHEPLDRDGDDLGIAGTAAGDPLQPGPAEEWGPTQEGKPQVARGTGEGPLRAYLVLGVPGEPAGPGGTPTALSPQEVEVILRARGIPPELRHLVRRYFELIGGNP